MMKNTNLTLTEIAIINAVKSGMTTVDEIHVATAIRKEGIIALGSKLDNDKMVHFDKVTNTFSPVESGKKIKLKGNLTLPISTFTKDGEFYVVRGDWHKIDPDTNLADIEWEDNSDEESDLKKVMRGLREEKAKTKVAKPSIPDIKDEDGEALPEHIKYLGAWRNIGDAYKIYPCEVSAKRAVIEISPRYRTADEEHPEFPYGSCSPKQVVAIEDMVDMIENGNVDKLPEIKIEDVIMNLGNCLPVKSTENGWEYLSTKKTKEGGKIIHYNFQITPKEKFTTLDTAVIGFSNLVDYVKSIATEFVSKYSTSANN